MPRKRILCLVFAAIVVGWDHQLTPIAAQSTSPASATDRAWVLDTLKRYSPDGWYIVDNYVRKVPQGTDFMTYWDGQSDDKRWDSLNTIVHEMSHGYMGELADMDAIFYYVSPSRSIMVPVGQVYRTQAMADSIPPELRTFRFSYVDSPEETLGSQQSGAYGLLDEMTAYWLGTQAAADMLPLFTTKASSVAWGDFFNSVNGTLYGILEFRFFVLRYILWAQDHNPAVYQDILANRAFRAAFATIDQRAGQFALAWFSRKATLYQTINRAGVGIGEDGDMLMIDTKDGQQGSGTFYDIYELLRREMLRPTYAPLLSALYDGQSAMVWPDAGVKPATKGNYAAEGSSDDGEVKEASIGSATSFSGRHFRPEMVKDPVGQVQFALEAKDRRGDGKQTTIDGSVINLILNDSPDLPLSSLNKDSYYSVRTRHTDGSTSWTDSLDL